MPTTGFIPADLPNVPTYDDLTSPPRDTLSAKHPYVSGKSITITENIHTSGYAWTASLDAVTHSHDGTFSSDNGPTLIMSRKGSTAEEAFKILVSAIEEQGFRVRP